jgi:hypothetical protein
LLRSNCSLRSSAGATRGREPPADREQVRGADEEDDDAEFRELEHRERMAEQLSGEVAREDVRRRADERQRPAEHRRVGEREEELRRREAVPSGQIRDHRDEHRDDRRVVHDAGGETGRADRRAEQFPLVSAGEPAQRRAETLDEAGALHPLAQHVHRDDGERRGTGEPGEGFGHGDASPRFEDDQRDEDREGSRVAGEEFGDEQEEGDEDEGEHQHRRERQGRHHRRTFEGE